MSNFFILQNTQSGKLALTAAEMLKWESVVWFFISSNDRTLVDQSAEGLDYFLTHEIFVLSSNHNENLEYIKQSIVKREYPVIAALANRQQNARVLELIQLCQTHRIRYGIIFDEADSTYPILRDHSILIRGKVFNYESCFRHPMAHRVGFVSATEGVLGGEDYPECARAELLRVQKDAYSDYYRAIHTEDAVLHAVEMSVDSNNEYALSVLRENHRHFFQRGVYGYRKIILNSNSQTSDMEEIARECVSMGMNAIVFNMNGLKVMRCDSSAEIPDISIRGRRFNKTLFEVVEQHSLDSRPLVIIGRRKVDRGLSFHYAPRDGSRGLIWTDIILAQIADVSLAVQKSGRMAGIIAHCPQYSGQCHYWAPAATLDRCVQKNRLNDSANLFAGRSLSEALHLAVREEDRFVEYVTLSEEEMHSYLFGMPHSLSDRLGFYSYSVVRQNTNTYSVKDRTFCFHSGLMLDPRADIPFVVQLSKEEMAEVMSSVIQRKILIKEVIRNKFPYLAETLDSYEFRYCSIVESIDFVKDCTRVGRKIYLTDSDEMSDASSDSYTVLIHPASNELVLLLWNGTKLTPIRRCSYIKTKGKYAGLICGKLCVSELCSEHEPSEHESSDGDAEMADGYEEEVEIINDDDEKEYEEGDEYEVPIE